jgi:aminopeptidase N
MMKLIVGEEVFRRGAVEFFTRFDGRAVTIDEMIDTIAEISGEDLTQFRRWYDVIGGLAIYVDGEYDAVAHRFTLHIRQQIDDPAIPALHLPLRMGLLGPDGKALRLQLVGETGRSDYDRVIELRSDVQTLMFENVPAEPVPSLFRGFSAPVRLFIDRDEDELVLLATHDGDVVNRWNRRRRKKRICWIHGWLCSPKHLKMRRITWASQVGCCNCRRSVASVSSRLNSMWTVFMLHAFLWLVKRHSAFAGNCADYIGR